MKVFVCLYIRQEGGERAFPAAGALGPAMTNSVGRAAGAHPKMFFSSLQSSRAPVLAHEVFVFVLSFFWTTEISLFFLAEKRHLSYLAQYCFVEPFLCLGVKLALLPYSQ